MAQPTSNSVTLISAETLANSLGATGLSVGTLLSNTIQFTNLTANGSWVEFSLIGQSLPVTYGSETNYPPVSISVYAGANGNATDSLLMSANVNPTLDQAGAFTVTGLVMLKANAKTATNVVGGGAPLQFSGLMQVPGSALGGGVKTILNVYSGPTTNGNVICSGNTTGNVVNLSFYAAAVTGANANASITCLQATTFNANVQLTTSSPLV